MAKKDSWPTEGHLNRRHEVYKWRHIGKGLYKIIDYKQTKSKYGNGISHILHLKAGNEKLNVWAPQRMSEELLVNTYTFVSNEGWAKSSKTGREYFKYPLFFR